MPQDDTPVGPNPSGLCMCGCGTPAPIARQSCRRKGYVRGRPVRYRPGHYRHKAADRYVVDPERGCWVWQGHLVSGYAYMSLKHRTVRAARVYYERKHGPIPRGLELDHFACQNRACVNPDHVEPVTKAVNARRRSATKRTLEAVAEIRAMAGRAPQSEIARRFGVHPSLISRIVRRDCWRDD